MNEDEGKESLILKDWTVLDRDFIFKSDEDYYSGKWNDEIEINGKKLKFNERRIKGMDGIKNGDTVYTSWYDSKAVGMVVKGLDMEKLTGVGEISDCLWGDLQFDQVLGGWTCTGFNAINPEAIAKVVFGD